MRHVIIDTQEVMIDATGYDRCNRPHACPLGYGQNSQDCEALGRNKRGLTTKIHVLVDALGNPLRFILTPGQRNDMTQAEKLTKNIKHTTLIADKGYDS